MDEHSTARHPIIDRILYLASLVSDPRSIDLSLDKLRLITATGTQPSANDIKVLQSIQAEIEDYLIHKEKFRSFTEESLRVNVETHFAATNPIKIARKAAFGRIAATILACVVITGALAGFNVIQGQVVMAFLICTLFAGLALVFQSVKKDLVAQLHGAWNYLMAGTVGTGLFALNFPIIAANSYLESHPMFQHGGLLVGAVPVYLLYYLAFYLYAKQLGASVPWLLRPIGVLVTCIGVAALGVFSPHPVPVTNEIFFDLAVAGFGVSVYLSGVAAVLGFMAASKTTALYSTISMFLAISMVLQTLGNGNFLLFVTFPSGDFSVNEQKGQILTGVFILAALAAQYAAAYKSKTSLSR